MSQAVALSPADLALASALVLLLALFTLPLRLGLWNKLLTAAVRTTVQLLLVGLVLKWLFASVNPWWLLLVSVVMLLAASREVVARQTRRFKGAWGFAMGSGAMLLSSFLVTIFALTVVISEKPWYEPRYAIPLLGMLLGNTMNGISIGMDRLTLSAWKGRAVIETRLSLGEKSSEAIGEIRKESIKSGMIPILNAMAAAGLVSLPGMMTGQILGGSPPLQAVRYQILIMFLIAAGSGFGTLFAVWLGSKRLFDGRERLRLDRLRNSTR